MEAARANLHLVSDDDATFPWPETGEALPPAEAHRKVRDLLDERDGLLTLTAKQARENVRLSKRIQVDEDPTSHPRGAEIVALIERWMKATGHERSKVSADRVKTVKARLSDGYSIEQLELAIDGIGSHRYVVAAKRATHGHSSQRFDELSHAIGSGEKVERAARLGYAARKAGWTLEGWPA